jgi:hypothetical protein
MCSLQQRTKQELQQQQLLQQQLLQQQLLQQCCRQLAATVDTAMVRVDVAAGKEALRRAVIMMR